jgi:hypothetical protein
VAVPPFWAVVVDVDGVARLATPGRVVVVGDSLVVAPPALGPSEAVRLPRGPWSFWARCGVWKSWGLAGGGLGSAGDGEEGDDGEGSGADTGQGGSGSDDPEAFAAFLAALAAGEAGGELGALVEPGHAGAAA